MTGVHFQAFNELAVNSVAMLDEQEVGRVSPDAECSPSFPVVNNRTFNVEWAGKTCFLGNTLVFRLFERLAKSEGRFISHTDLIEDVWDGEREPSTIRGVAKRLRDKLRKGGMRGLADAIVGDQPGHYGFILVRRKKGKLKPK